MRTAALLLVLCVGCYFPVETQLPAITTSGANTFGFEIDGNVFPLSGGGQPDGGYPPFQVSVTHRADSAWDLFIVASTTKTPTAFQLWLNGIRDTGFYFLSYGKGEAAASYESDDRRAYVDIDTISPMVHLLRFDMASHIVSGTFSMVMHRDTFSTITNRPTITADTISISSGRFDFNYK